MPLAQIERPQPYQTSHWHVSVGRRPALRHCTSMPRWQTALPRTRSQHLRLSREPSSALPGRSFVVVLRVARHGPHVAPLHGTRLSERAASERRNESIVRTLLSFLLLIYVGVDPDSDERGSFFTCGEKGQCRDSSMVYARVGLRARKWRVSTPGRSQNEHSTLLRSL